MKLRNVNPKLFRKGLTILGAAASLALFTGCPNPSAPGKEPEPTPPEPIIITENEFETPNKKIYGDFEMYDFVGTKRNITSSNVDKAAGYYTRYASNLIETTLDSLSGTAKQNPLVQEAVQKIKDEPQKGGIYTYHNTVEAALAPIFKQMTKTIVRLGDVNDETNWKGCCRYMIYEAYGYGLGERRTESRPETQKYQEEQKKAKMLVDPNKLAARGNTLDEAIANNVIYYFEMIDDDMEIPVEDLKKFMNCELYSEALTANFDLNKTWLGLPNYEHSTAVIAAIENPYAKSKNEVNETTK